MTIEGLFISLQRSIKKLFQKFTGLFRRKKKESEDQEAPKSWQKQKNKKGLKTYHSQKFTPSTRKIYRFPLIRTVKRFTAAILCFLNFVISQFLLASQTQAAPAFILFLLNAFILLDYLWKTRTKEE